MGDNMKEKIMDWISFFVGLIFVLLIYFFREDLFKVFAVVSIGSIVYGTFSILKNERYGYPMVSFGSSIGISLILYHFGKFDKGQCLTFSLMFGIFLLMLITFIFTFVNKKLMVKHYSLIVDAKVIDLVKNPNTNQEFYQPVYSYTIDDRVYTVNALGYTKKRIPKIGDSIKLYVDPNDYESVYFDKEKFTAIQDLAILVVLMIVSLIISIFLFF